MRVVVVGGGIAGLAAAHALAGRAEVTVVEAGDRVGGKLRTSPIEGPFGSVDVEGVTKRVWVRSGNIICATSTDRNDSLGAFLRRDQGLAAGVPQRFGHDPSRRRFGLILDRSSQFL